MMSCPDIGKPAPDFRLRGVQEGKDIEVSLRDYRGKWVVLVFYAMAFTPI